MYAQCEHISLDPWLNGGQLCQLIAFHSHVAVEDADLFSTCAGFKRLDVSLSFQCPFVLGIDGTTSKLSGFEVVPYQSVSSKRTWNSLGVSDQTIPKTYGQTSIKVSSAMCSILLGSYAPVDTSDGSGTNLNQLQELNIHLVGGVVGWLYPKLCRFDLIVGCGFLALLLPAKSERTGHSASICKNMISG